MNIPEYPDFRPLEIEDKNLFDSFLKRHPNNLSEYTFTNFFVWRKLDKTLLTLINGNICVLVLGPGGKQYFMMPLGENRMEDTLLKCLEKVKEVVRLSPEFTDKFVSGSSIFTAEEDRNNFDYVYLTKDLIELKGRKYDSKRNHLNNLLKSHSFEYHEMNSKHVKECIELNDEWCKGKKRESEAFPNLECEGDVVKEALENLDYLELTGGTIKINGKIKAFSIGEMLNGDTAVIHIEKADPSIRGLSQLINREFVKNAWSKTTYINREQDLGHPGLRRAKLSYHPVRLEKKYNIRLKN